MPAIPAATGLAQLKALFDSTVKPLIGADGGIAIASIADLALLVPSTVSQETYAALSPAGSLKESVGDLIIKALVAGKLDLVAKLFEAALGIPRDDFTDDRIGLHRSRIEDQAIKATWHPHQLVAATLEANPTAFDGTALFADSRTDSILGTFDNALAPSMASAGGPTVAEYVTAIKAAQTALRGFKDAENDPINLAPEFGLLIPSGQHWQAKACAENELIGAAGAQQTNEVKGSFTPMVNPFLSSADVAFMFVKGTGAKPLLLQEREALTTESLGEGSEEWIIRKRAVFSVRARRAMAAGHPGRIVRMTFTHDS